MKRSPKFREQHRCANHKGKCLKFVNKIQKRKLWHFVFDWLGFFFRRIVYQIGKNYRNILALMSVLDYVCPIFRRLDQPVLPLRPEDVKHVPSQFLHR